MKKLFLYLLPLFFLSCTKDLDEAKPQGGSFQFKYDGVLKVYESVSAAKVSNDYSFVVTKTPTTQNYFSFHIYADSLKPGTYPKVLVQYREYEVVSYNTEGLTVKILENNGGLVRGEFTGTMVNGSVITEGSFEGVQIIY